MISTRFAPALGVVVGLALLPMFIHRYAGVVDDGRVTERIATSLAGFSSIPTQTATSWGEHEFASHDWIRRKYLADGDEVVLTVIRSYDLKRLYHHPENTVAYGGNFAQHETKRLASRPAIPVHVLSSSDGRSVAMYVLLYDGTFVESPIRFQIRTAGETLVSAEKAMTLFFVHDPAVREGADPNGLQSTALLFAAIDSFLAQKSDVSSGGI